MLNIQLMYLNFDLMLNKITWSIGSLLSWILIIKLATFEDLDAYGQESLTFSCVFILLIIHFITSTLRLKLLIITIIPLSYLGEIIFSSILGLYDYQLGHVPIYIPIGHAVVFATAVKINQNELLRKFIKDKKIIIYSLYTLSFLFVIIVFQDNLSLLLGILMLVTIYKKQNHTLYLIVGIVVLYLEIIGTQFGCWSWKKEISIFKTTNPPLGSIFIYIGGDILLNRLIRKYLNLRNKVKRNKKLVSQL